jgi:hypothetical protein
MEEGASKLSSRNRRPALSILAKKTSDLAIKEKNVYSPILKKWHPLPAGVAVATLHACFENELKQFTAGLTELTPDAAQVLKAADKLEKDLIHIAIEDSMDIADGGKSLVKQMPPYEAGTVMANLVKAWIKEQVDKLKGCTDQKLEQEVTIFYLILRLHCIWKVETAFYIVVTVACFGMLICCIDFYQQ